MSACEECPRCLGSGQITGPKSAGYRWDPMDQFNAAVRPCDECEGTGMVTAVRAAGLRAVSMDKVMAVIAEVAPELDRAANEQIEREMAALFPTEPEVQDGR